MNAVAPYLKALVAFLVPGVVALVAAVSDGSDNGSTITGPEWVGILAACILTAGGVFVTPNRDPKAQHQDESVQPPRHRNDLGYGAIELVVGVILVIILVVVLLRLI